jgi:transcriptional regulator with XRE-family HTH domain
MNQHHNNRPISPFGEALRAFLRRKGLSQTHLADESMVPRETVSRMIRGDRLTGTTARIHLRSLIRAGHDLGVIRTAEEANYLLTQIPGTAELDRRDKDDLALLLKLEEPVANEPRIDPAQQQGELTGRDRKEQTLEDIAWSLYVALMTRIAIQPLSKVGLLREALSSLYILFTGTRIVLQDTGAQLARMGEQPIGWIGISMLNDGLRPFMTRWHPLLQQYEQGRMASKSPYEHEQAWERAGEMRQELARLQKHLEEYAETLAQIAGVPHRKVFRSEPDTDDM